jgi:hypothetical protein
MIENELDINSSIIDDHGGDWALSEVHNERWKTIIDDRS